MGKTSSSHGRHHKILWGSHQDPMGKASSCYGKQLKFVLSFSQFSLTDSCQYDSGMYTVGNLKFPTMKIGDLNMATAQIRKSVKALKISQSNELTEAAYYLPLQAKRALWLCLVECYAKKDEEQIAETNFTILVSDYQAHFNVSVETASRDLKKGIQALSESSVTFFPKGGKYEEVKMPWLALSGLRRGRGQWEVEFNHHMMPYIQGLTSQFTTYGLVDVEKISSVRTIRLYESLCQYRSTGIWKVSQEWLADRFKLPDTQRRNTAELKRTFLNPSIKRINTSTPLLTEVSDDGNGNFIFTILPKKDKA